MIKKLLILILILPVAAAHLDAGEDVVLDGYEVDFGYSPEDPNTDNKVNMLFNLLNATTEEQIEPTSVWIRVSSSKEVVFAGTFQPDLSSVTFTYVFPYADEYEIRARFKDGENILVENDFDLEISKAPKSFLFITIKVLVILFLICAAIFLWKKKK